MALFLGKDPAAPPALQPLRAQMAPLANKFAKRPAADF